MRNVCLKALPLLAAALLAVTAFFRCSTTPSPVANGTAETGGAKVAGLLYNSDGSRAAGVSVNLYSANFTPSLTKLKAGTAKQSADSTVVTDAQGHYSIPLPDSGVYNIVGVAGDGKSVFIDSVVVRDTNAVAVRPDTVRVPGEITGVSFMPGQDSINQIRVIMYMPGTNFMTKPSIGGAFSFIYVPQGTYQLIFDPTYNTYDVKILTVKVTSGAATNLDTVLLYGGSYTGIPVVNAGNDTTVSIKDTVRLRGSAVDTFGRIAKMEWDIGATGHFTPTLSGDTFFVTSSTPDSNFLCVFRATDNDSNVVADTMRVRIILSPPVVNAGNDTTVSINDTVHLHGSATDAYSKIVKLEWDIGGTGTFRTSLTGDTFFIAPSTPVNWYKCIFRATDDDGVQALDTDTVHVILDAPVANAGPDTIVSSISSQVTLHGSATQQFGTIVKWEWNIRNHGFVTTATSDTVITTPDTIMLGFPCVLRVTDDDGNIGIDTTVIAVGPAAPSLISPINGAMGIRPALDTAKWQQVSDAYYELQILDIAKEVISDDTVPGPASQALFSSMTWNSPLMSNTTYYWRIRILSIQTPVGWIGSGWSAEWKFTTAP